MAAMDAPLLETDDHQSPGGGELQNGCLDATMSQNVSVLRIPRQRVAGWEKGLLEKCTARQQQSVHHKVFLLSQNTFYRVGDIVMQKGARWKDDATEIARPTWSSSVLHRVLNVTGGASVQKNLEVLFTTVAGMHCAAGSLAPVSDNSTLVLHARMGDKEHIRAEFEPPLAAYIRQKSIAAVQINVVFHYGPWRHDSLAKSPKLLARMGHLYHITNASILANARRLYDLIESVQGMGVANVTVSSSASVDGNLCKYSHSCHFLSTGGGFGEIALDLNKRIKPNCSSSSGAVEKHFLTFSTTEYAAAAHRNAISAKRCGFDTTRVYSPADMDKRFRSRNAHLLSLPRGFGYWSWKPYFILRHLVYESNDGDLVCYNDANYEMRDRTFPATLYDWTRASNHSILVFENKPDIAPFYEKSWSKRDAFILLGVDYAIHRETPQCWAGFFCAIRNLESVQFVSQWATYASDERIITDQPSQLERESPDMRENRHDQTILSLLLKKWGVETRKFPSGPVYNWQKSHREKRKGHAPTVVEGGA